MTTKTDIDLQALVEELHVVEEEAHSARSASWVILPLSIIALVLAVAAIVVAATLSTPDTTVTPREASVTPPKPVGDYIAANTPAPAADSAAAKRVKFEPYERVDPELPVVPPGAVKKFKVDVYEHVTKVSADKAPTRVWSYAVNGKDYRGTGVSAPIVVNQGDLVEMTLVNGGSKAMDVTLPHSIDFHSSEVAPNVAFKTIGVGEKWTFRFEAKHPGVFMYHCATQPVLMHTGAGMVGMMVVKPAGLPPAKEYWLTQQEYYIGEPGKDPSMVKMEAKNPDVIAFNGYAAQYQKDPIVVDRGERVRAYVLNAGPSIWSGFHVIGTVFDRTVVEGTVGKSSQTINLAPSQGGWVEFTLDQEGVYPFVTHAFGDMVRGAVGAFATSGAPKSAQGGHDMGGKAAADSKPVAKGAVAVELGEMYVKPAKTEFKAGKVTFAVQNAGQLPHALMVAATPVKTDAGGEPLETGAIAHLQNLAAGKSGTVTADLKVGSYELLCNVPGHYAAGQKATVTVTP